MKKKAIQLFFLLQSAKRKIEKWHLHYLVVFFILYSFQNIKAQVPADKQWQNKILFKQLLSDTGLINKSVQVVHLQIPSGGADTMPHKHPCELIGYVLEGEIETKMQEQPAQKYKAGEVFYEYPGQVHEFIKNVQANAPAKIILFYVFTTGTKLYIPFNRAQAMKH